MRKLRLTHLYLGSLFGPLLIVFAISGAWQVFRFNDARKDGSYKPAKVITLFTDIHKDQVLPGVSRRKGEAAAMRYFALGASAGLALTSILGIVMAYRMSRRPVLVTALLLAGVALPATLLVLAR